MTNQVIQGIENAAYEMSPQLSTKVEEITMQQTKSDEMADERDYNSQWKVVDAESSKRTPILTKTLSPLLTTMFIFGFFYTNDKEKKVSCKIGQFYVSLVNILLVGYLGLSAYGLALSNDTNGYLMLSITIIFKLKGVVQSLIIFHLCHTGRLCAFIKMLEKYLESIKVNECSKVERQFARKCRYWVALLFILLLIWLASSIFMSMYKGGPVLMQLNKALSSPFADSTENRYKRCIPDVLTTCAWFLPMTLCVVLTHSLRYAFEELYRYMEEQKSNDNSGGLCCTKYVRTMRKNFITLTSLCTDLDNMMNMLMMVSYLVDIVLICLLCKVLLFNYAELAARLLLISWIVMPTISLAVLSMHASKLYDTGQGMARFVQGLVVDKVSSDAKVELDLLLFHLNMDPVVMTIWQMIPLNRSIIVSIFVSIITYLTMLLSFL